MLESEQWYKDLYDGIVDAVHLCLGAYFVSTAGHKYNTEVGHCFFLDITLAPPGLIPSPYDG